VDSSGYILDPNPTSFTQKIQFEAVGGAGWLCDLSGGGGGGLARGRVSVPEPRGGETDDERGIDAFISEYGSAVAFFDGAVFGLCADVRHKFGGVVAFVREFSGGGGESVVWGAVGG
jgi:hypothetical protein